MLQFEECVSPTSSFVTIFFFLKSDVETCGRFTFPGEWLKNDTNNVFEFALPYNASGGDVNFRNYSISVL